MGQKKWLEIARKGLAGNERVGKRERATWGHRRHERNGEARRGTKKQRHGGVLKGCKQGREQQTPRKKTTAFPQHYKHIEKKKIVAIWRDLTPKNHCKM